MSNIAYIAIGSNLDNPHEQVEKALSAIAAISRLHARSSWYLSKPINPPEHPDYTQPDYVNGVIAIETDMGPLPLLLALQNIENQHGRERNMRWGARTIDLDILLFNNDIINTARLTIPHPQMKNRNFVIFPLYEIAPRLFLPNGQHIAELAKALDTEGLEKLP